MSYRFSSTLKWSCIVFSIFLAGLGRVQAEAPPNILLINLDNFGYGDLGCYGSQLHRTPEIDRLAAAGVRFTDFYAASPVCTSSRAALLTGSYPRRNSMEEFAWDGSVLRPVSPNGLHPDELTIADILKERGYVTAMLGKWHLGDQTAFLPTRQGFDSFLGLLYSDEMDDSYTAFNWPPMPLMRNEEVVEAPADLETMTERYTREAIQLIRQNRKRPFFIYLAHMSPGSRKVPIAGRPFQGQSANGPYGDTVEEIDWSTGQILRALDEAGLSDRTLVIFTADNGAPPPRGMKHHGSNAPFALRARYDASEGGFRVPMIARWPGQIPAGLVCREIATNMDFLPTLAHLAGAELPRDRVIDGKDIGPLLTGVPEARSPHPYFLYYFGGQLQGLRAGKWKLMLPLSKPLIQLGMGQLGIEATGRSARLFGNPVPLRLFNMETDLRETTNVASQHPEVVSRLMKMAVDARRDLGDLEQPGNNIRPAGHLTGPQPQLLHRGQKAKKGR